MRDLYTLPLSKKEKEKGEKEGVLVFVVFEVPALTFFDVEKSMQSLQ